MLSCIEALDGFDESEDKAGDVYPWKRAKKVAAMLSFSGQAYYGMQRNPGDDIKTIEDELMVALSKSGAIDPEWEKVPQKAFFKRASRTDKGVSAARMVVSLKMLPEKSLVTEINKHLPTDIRMQALVRATKNFNCQTHADGRTYLYLLPTAVFCKDDVGAGADWQCPPEIMTKVTTVLQQYIGSHYFHNYTAGKLPREPASRRLVQECEATQPFIREGREWCLIRVRGQSFMLHQIRKMIGLMIAIVRGEAGMEILDQAWGNHRVDIPLAPGLGLLLDKIHYNRYNQRYSLEGQHDDLEWDREDDAVEEFKENFILSNIIKTEVEEEVMLKWIREVLPMHTFQPRTFDNIGDK